LQEEWHSVTFAKNTYTADDDGDYANLGDAVSAITQSEKIERDGPRLFFWPAGDVRRPRLHGSIRPSFARLGETFFVFGFLLQFDPSVRDLQQHGSMFFRHRHCQTLTFLRESPVRCGVTHRSPPTSVG
jgi:hypothetical protein